MLQENCLTGTNFMLDPRPLRAEPCPPPWQQRFLMLLPTIRRHAEIRFRTLGQEARAEMIQETIARTVLDYVRLVERGKENVGSAGSLSRFAVAQVRQGRRVGGQLNARDITSEYCRRRTNRSRVSLTDQDESASWRDALMEDRQSTPADLAAMRIDIAEWLATLSGRDRRIAETLAKGETTIGAARIFGISPGRVSQLRRELCRKWHAFHRQPVPGWVG
ncbi:MAG: hypothetical protein WD468_12090 [Pirellulales bacterium]